LTFTSLYYDCNYPYSFSSWLQIHNINLSQHFHNIIQPLLCVFPLSYIHMACTPHLTLFIWFLYGKSSWNYSSMERMAIPTKNPYTILTHRDFFLQYSHLLGTQQVPFGVMDIFTHCMDDFISFHFSMLVHIRVNLSSNTTHYSWKSCFLQNK
jgi:hypothetical protein